MSEISKGGPAFPQKEPLNSDWHGMTLRDYFAAKAMQAWNSNQNPDDTPISHIADLSYRMADAMLAAREIA